MITDTAAQLVSRLGYQVQFTRHLEKPRFERERFSGGVNNSARERNNKKRVVYVMEHERFAIVPEYMKRDFLRALEKQAALSIPETRRER